MKGKTVLPDSALREYLSPSVRVIPFHLEVIPFHLEHAICDSPVPGGNEDIGYEDWN